MEGPSYATAVHPKGTARHCEPIAVHVSLAPPAPPVDEVLLEAALEEAPPLLVVPVPPVPLLVVPLLVAPPPPVLPALPVS